MYSSQDHSQPVASGHGYRAWFVCARLTNLSGCGTSSISLPLGAYHASMIGNPSGTRPALVSGYDYAVRRDPAPNCGVGGYHYSGNREAQSLAVGEGIWVFSHGNTTVRIVAP